MAITVNGVDVTPQFNYSTNYAKPEFVTDEEWQRVIDANPWSKDKWSRNPTFWDELANAFGLRGGYDDYADNMINKSNQYYADAVNRMREENHNSEDEKIKRLRSAGINADLQDGAGLANATEASEYNEELGKELPGFGDTGAKIFESCMGVLNFTLGMSEKIGNVIGIYKTNQGIDLTNDEKLTNIIDSFLGKYQPAITPMMMDKDGNISESGIKNAQDSLKLWANEYADRYGYKGNVRNRFLGAINTFSESDEFVRRTYGQWNDTIDQRTEAAGKYGSKYTGDPQIDAFDSALKALQPLTELNDKLQKITLEGDVNKAQYESDYYGELDGKAEGANAAARARAEKVFNETWAQTMAEVDKLKKSQDKWDKRIGYILSIALPLIKEQVFSAAVGGKPLVNINNTTQNRATTNYDYSTRNTEIQNN